MITLYGLKNCDTCKKAMTALEAGGKPFAFVDIRAEADLADTAPAWLAAVGPDALVNARSTTWRGLSDADKAAAKAGDPEVLVANPTLIKRPVIETDAGETLVGWTPATRAALGLA